MTTIHLILYLGFFTCFFNNLTGCSGQVVIQPVFVTSTQGISASSTQSSSSADTSGQVVRIVVNTVVSSGDGSNNPVVVQQSAVTSDHTAQLSFPGGDHIRPSSSRPEKRKADGSLFFPDGNIMDHGTVDASALVTHEESYTGHTEEANVQIADYAKPSQTLPTGLVTTMGGTVVLAGQTTVHETKVIGTYISGTYAQILQSTSRIFENDRNVVTATVLASSASTEPSPTSTSTTPTKITISPTPTSTGKWPHLKSRPPYTGVQRKNTRTTGNADKTRQSRELTPSLKPSRSRQSKNLLSSLAAQRSRQRKSHITPTMSTLSVTSPTMSTTQDSSVLQTITPSTVLSTSKSSKSSTRKGRTRSTIRAKSSTRSHNAYKNAVASRYSYTRNPNKYYPRRRRVKSNTNSNTDSGESMEARTIEMTTGGTSLPQLSTVTSTVTTELTQFYGSDGTSNSLVFTTTYEQPMVVTISSTGETPPLTSSSIRVELPENNIFNPFLEDPLEEENDKTSKTAFNTSFSLSTITDDVTTTETLLQTSFLPITMGSSTSILTLTQTFLITKIVHALRTVPPPELMASVVSVDLNAAESEHREDFMIPNSNSSDIFALLNLTDNDVTQPTTNPTPELPVTENPIPQQPQPPPNQFQQNGNPFFNPFVNPFAYLGYGMVPPMVPPGVVPQGTLTTSSAVYSTETIYGTKVLPIWDGLSTSYHTTKAPSTTKVHTNYETYVTTQTGLPGMPQHPVLPNFAPAQTITQSTTIVTTEIETNTQVLKLMYDGYKTSYRTLLSTSAVVKTLTTQITTTVPFGQYPGFFG